VALFSNVELVRVVRMSNILRFKRICVLTATTAFLGTLLIAGCGVDKPSTAAAAPPTTSTPAPAQPGLIVGKTDAMLTISGPLIVEHQIDVTAQREGVVAEISADAGTRVRTGQLLAQMDDRQLSANLEAARAKTRSIENDLKNWQAEEQVLKADYVRAQRLWNEKLIAEEQLQHAQFKAESEQWDIRRVQELLNTSKQEERSLQLEMEKTRITAPFDGVVARRYLRLGQGLSKGDRAFWVTAEGPLRMRFTLPEKFIGHLKRGQELPLTSPDVPQEHHLVRVIEVSPVVDPASGTIEVLAEIQSPHGELRPGMTASIRIADIQ
jgi:RND family efflux transporter MFP subunit